MSKKLDLNNELILMKKLMKQSKVVVIHKLVRKIKKIKKQEKDEMKQEEKVRIIIQQINYLKRIDNFELSKLALTSTTDHNKIISNNKSTPAEVALSLICTLNTVQDHISEIMDQYSLDESSDWRTEILEVGRKKLKKIRKIEFTKRTENFKADKQLYNEISLKREDWLKKNISADTNENEESGVQNESNADQAIRNTKKKSSDLAKESPVIKLKKSEDSFFVTESGESYMSVKNSEPNSSSYLPKTLKSKSHHQDTIKSYRSDKSTFYNDSPKITSNSQNSFNSFGNKSKINNHKSTPYNKFHRNETAFENHKDPKLIDKASTEQKLHPSWAAKLAQKPVITEFKGTKIKFE